jgi:hypothetical protein
MEAPSIRLAEEARRTLELELEALGSTGEA